MSVECRVFLWIALCATSGCAAAPDSRPLHTVATFSIVAYDPTTGELGVATASKFIAVGAVVPWAEAGVGVIATQAWANTSYGPRGLELLAKGLEPSQAMDKLTAEDAQAIHRQVAILDSRGRIALHTGDACFEWAGHRAGEQYAVLGNVLAGPQVLEAMAAAFGAAEGDLGDRLLAALEAGEAAGGDRRGRQSAALLIVRDGWGYSTYNDRYRDLRVDDHEQPVAELMRIYTQHRKTFPPPK